MRDFPKKTETSQQDVLSKLQDMSDVINKSIEEKKIPDLVGDICVEIAKLETNFRTILDVVSLQKELLFPLFFNNGR
ncbi:hypothetical protein GCK72_011273 [Caenorhabditis remanei]|uniref:Uncharacterized protein n=1 Tax=Caenorhabditis remanei TaxID=31234 RepID=A0A6A5H5J9_CAERE|nr:hypothetical protein GCK72_011273 [Caenorhabditis remanei]KAF1763008.1 hypothetical protein GCK72_011273 [Caenorhabditis remanei]